MMTTKREAAEFRWREAAKAEREYSLGCEAELERLRAALTEIYGHATADNDGQPCCDTVVMLAKQALHPSSAVGLLLTKDG